MFRKLLAIDLNDFYGILFQAILWAKSFDFIYVTDYELELLRKCRQTILFFNAREYEKRKNPSSDLKEGCFEETEMAEIINDDS